MSVNKCCSLLLLLRLLICYATPVNELWSCDDDSKMILVSWKCDGKFDCDDASDESLQNCPNAECEEDQFKCEQGTCIMKNQKCDGNFDCHTGSIRDYSDEEDCDWDESDCDSNTFNCLDNTCVSDSYVCDGENDCPDGTDEQNCTWICGTDRTLCNNSAFQRCIKLKYLCDGQSDCEDGEDEENCGTATTPNIAVSTARLCPASEFHCDDICVPVERACDGFMDCKRDRDEGVHCHEPCPAKTNNLIWAKSSAGRPVCDHICKNIPYGQKCACFAGYRLGPDGVSCSTEDGVFPELYFSVDNKIRSIFMNPLHPDEESLFMDFNNQQAKYPVITYAMASNTLLWVENEPGSIHIKDSQRRHRVLLNVTDLLGLAYDWKADNVYATYRSTNGTAPSSGVSVFNLKKALFSPEGRQLCDLDVSVTLPVSIALDVKKRRMVLIDLDVAKNLSRLLMANMDGGNFETLASDRERTMYCVTVDDVTGIAYWIEYGTLESRVEALRLDGLQRKTIVSTLESEMRILNIFSLTVFENRLYFSDSEAKAIWCVDASNGKSILREGPSAVPLLKVTFASDLLAVHVVHPAMQGIGSLENNGYHSHNCSHVYLAMANASSSRCICPRYMSLKSDKKTCTANTLAKCRKLSFKPNEAYLTPSNLSSVESGTRVKYSCRKGFHIEGIINATSVVLKCLDTGKWDQDTVRCVKYNCKDLRCGGGKCVTIGNKGSVCQCGVNSFSYSACPNRLVNKKIKKTSGGLVAGLVITFLVFTSTCMLVSCKYLKKTNYSILKRTHNPGDRTCVDGSKNVSNPNYTPLGSSTTTKDSQIDKDGLSMEVSDFTFQSLKMSDEKKGKVPEPKGKSNKPFALEVKKSFASSFNLRKSESQESIVPRS